MSNVISEKQEDERAKLSSVCMKRMKLQGEKRSGNINARHSYHEAEKGVIGRRHSNKSTLNLYA